MGIDFKNWNNLGIVKTSNEFLDAFCNFKTNWTFVIVHKIPLPNDTNFVLFRSSYFRELDYKRKWYGKLVREQIPVYKIICEVQPDMPNVKLTIEEITIDEEDKKIVKKLRRMYR